MSLGKRPQPTFFKGAYQKFFPALALTCKKSLLRFNVCAFKFKLQMPGKTEKVLLKINRYLNVIKFKF